MKPHFGQSDAVMNKLAGCNSFPNAGKTIDIAELEHMTTEPLPKGYFGHELEIVLEAERNNVAYAQQKWAEAEERTEKWKSWYESLSAASVKERDAAYDLGYKDAIKALMAEKPNHDVQFWKDETHRAIEAGDVAYAKAYKRIAALELCLDNFIAWLDTFPYENSVTTIHKIREQLVKP
jgi:hypothetical protein